MEDLVVLRRRNASIGRMVGTKKQLIRMSIPKGTFTVFVKVAELLEAEKGSAIMFAFSRKNDCAFVYTEDPQVDSYYFTRSNKSYRFTSQVLMNYFIDFFKIENKKEVFFEVSATKNEKGMFAVTLECDLYNKEKGD